jgi:hypothetical protein
MLSRASTRGKKPTDHDDEGIGSALRVVESVIGGKLAPDAMRTLAEHAVKSGKNPAAVALSKLGASKGGKARAAKLSAKRKKEIARKAALKRWRDKVKSLNGD